MNKKLIDAMADLDEEVLLSEVKALVEQGIPTLNIIASLQEGIVIVGKRFIVDYCKQFMGVN